MELDTQQTEELNAAVELMDNKIESLEADKKTLQGDKMLILQEKVCEIDKYQSYIYSLTYLGRTVFEL